MKNFKDFSIKPKIDFFVGDKIKILKVLNREIIVHGFKIDKSKFENSNSEFVMSLQIEYMNCKRVLFTGSKILAEMIKEVPEDGFPFKSTIIKEGESFVFK